MSDVEKGTTSQINHRGNGAGSGELWNPSQAYATRQPSRIGNPGALGLFSFASTTFILSLINVQTRGVTTPNVVVGMAIFCGGLVQLLAGMWEFPRGNVFGGTAFSSYGAFWMSFATIFWPSSGIITSYTSADELDNALGIYLITWFMFTAMMTLGALRKNAGFIALFVCLSITFLLLAVSKFTHGNVTINTAGGAFGIITAFIAYYCAVSELLVKEESYFMLPLGVISKRSA